MQNHNYSIGKWQLQIQQMTDKFTQCSIVLYYVDYPNSLKQGDWISSKDVLFLELHLIKLKDAAMEAFNCSLQQSQDFV